MRIGRGNTVVTGHREFESAAKRSPVNRNHDRLAAIFNLQEKRQQPGAALAFAGSHLAEFFDIRASDERAAATDQNSRLHSGIFDELCNGFADAFRHAGTQRIHRRIVNRDDGNVAVLCDLNQVAHLGRSL